MGVHVVHTIAIYRYTKALGHMPTLGGPRIEVALNREATKEYKKVVFCYVCGSNARIFRLVEGPRWLIGGPHLSLLMASLETFEISDTPFEHIHTELYMVIKYMTLLISRPPSYKLLRLRKQDRRRSEAENSIAGMR